MQKTSYPPHIHARWETDAGLTCRRYTVPSLVFFRTRPAILERLFLLTFTPKLLIAGWDNPIIPSLLSISAETNIGLQRVGREKGRLGALKLRHMLLSIIQSVSPIKSSSSSSPKLLPMRATERGREGRRRLHSRSPLYRENARSSSAQPDRGRPLTSVLATGIRTAGLHTCWFRGSRQSD